MRDGTATCDTTGDLTVRLDPPPPADRVAAFCRATAERLRAGPPPARLADLEPEKLWTESSAHGLVAPIGDSTDGSLVEVPLGDDPPHALIGGPSGSGKTNLIYAWLGSLAARYGPEELALYLLDFKEGVSFARFAPGPRDPSWLPQVRLAGINVNGDREFGLAMLRHLGEELRTRAQAAKRHEATKLAELRAEDPGRALAPDRRGDRRVPGAAGRSGRGRRRGGDAARGPRPARPLAGHPPGAGLAGRLRASRRCGAAPA